MPCLFHASPACVLGAMLVMAQTTQRCFEVQLHVVRALTKSIIYCQLLTTITTTTTYVNLQEWVRSVKGRKALPSRLTFYKNLMVRKSTTQSDWKAAQKRACLTPQVVHRLQMRPPILTKASSSPLMPSSIHPLVYTPLFWLAEPLSLVSGSSMELENS